MSYHRHMMNFLPSLPLILPPSYSHLHTPAIQLQALVHNYDPKKSVENINSIEGTLGEHLGSAKRREVLVFCEWEGCARSWRLTPIHHLTRSLAQRHLKLVEGGWGLGRWDGGREHSKNQACLCLLSFALELLGVKRWPMLLAPPLLTSSSLQGLGSFSRWSFLDKGLESLCFHSLPD